VDLTIKLTLNEQFLKDVLVTICETPGMYGIGSWGAVKRVTKGKPDDYTEVELEYDLKEKDEGNREGLFVMGLPQVAEGIRRILTTPRDKMALHPSNMGRVAAAVCSDDSGQIDGEAADWIAQAAIYNEVVYG
jgi:hypothetical protein